MEADEEPEPQKMTDAQYKAWLIQSDDSSDPFGDPPPRPPSLVPQKPAK